MNEREYQKARATIIGVSMSRLAAVSLGIMNAWQGELIGAAILFAVAMLLHFALPVIPDKRRD